MRENRSYGSEGGEPQVNAAFLPLSLSQAIGDNRSTLEGSLPSGFHLVDNMVG